MSEVATIPASKPSAEAGGRVVGMIAEFDTPGALKAAARSVREAGYTRWDTHSPFPVHGIDGAMGIRMTKLPWIVMIGGVVGCLTGLFLQWYANAVDPKSLSFIPTFAQSYRFLVSGKPYFSLPANIPIIFELTVLFSAITTVIAMLALNNLPLFYNPVFNSERFRRVTQDKFFVSIDGCDRKFDPTATESFLQSLGATAVEPVLEFPSPAKPPIALRRATLILLTLLLIPPAIIWKAWYATTPKPRIHIVQDMDNQVKFRPQHATPLFADHRAMRPPVPQTVARSDYDNDSHYYKGRVGDGWAKTLPLHRLKVDERFVRRGRDRFNIYCSPCHGRLGDGKGTVAVRATELGGAWVPPANLHEPQYLARDVGHIFNTISNGVRTMPEYGDIIPVEDRWAIVAYVRALQRSRFATPEDVPPALRERMRELPLSVKSDQE